MKPRELASARMSPRLYIAAVMTALIFASCDGIEVTDPFSGFNTSEAPGLSDRERSAIEGIYHVAEGAGLFGSRVILKWNGEWLNIFAGKDGIVGALKPLHGGPDYGFAGRAWLNDSHQEVDLSLYISSANGGDSISKGLRPFHTVITGTENEGRPLLFDFACPVNSSRPFLIVAHGGGFNNAGRFNLPVNSLAIIRAAERFGANGIEIDVRLTKDGVPILFHDDNFTRRMIESEYLFGPVKDFTFAHIRSFGLLGNGEPVPMLSEALDIALRETSIEFVQLDIKTPETLLAVFDLQKEFHELAGSLNRKLRIYLDLTTEEIAETYLRDPRGRDALCMCELDEETALDVGAEIWSPRWTLGALTGRARAMRERGVRFVPWTVNEPRFIDVLLLEDQADGVLTDYPNLVAFKWYSYEK